MKFLQFSLFFVLSLLWMNDLQAQKKDCCPVPNCCIKAAAGLTQQVGDQAIKSLTVAQKTPVKQNTCAKSAAVKQSCQAKTASVQAVSTSIAAKTKCDPADCDPAKCKPTQCPPKSCDPAKCEKGKADAKSL